MKYFKIDIARNWYAGGRDFFGKEKFCSLG